MKRIKTLIIVAIAFCCVAMPASAQFKWGLQAGIVANDLKFSDKLFDTSNRVGFTGGLTAQFSLPFGLAFQGSLMYVHRTGDVKSGTSTERYKADYLALPVHFKYNISLPAVSNIIRPYIFTGPSFSYLLSKKKVMNYDLSKGDIEWDLGLGLELVNHLQISAGYGFGCYKIIKWGDNSVRTNSWTVTLGYLF